MTIGLVLEWIGGILVLVGAAFMIVGAIGLIRMPDVFTRMHAASVSETLSVGLILIGLTLYGGLTLVTVKLIFLVLFIALTGPVATHAVARAALHAGVKPLGADGKPLETGEPRKGEAGPSKS